MTPEERAAAIADAYGLHGLEVRAIVDAIREAVAVERERCLGLAIGLIDGEWEMGPDATWCITTRIRDGR